MSKILSKCMWIIIPLLMIACQRDEQEDPNTGKGSGNRFLLNYTIASSVSENARATIPSETGESVMNSLYLLFFEHSTGGTGKYITYYEVPAEDIPSTLAGTIEVDINGIDGLSNSSSYVVLLVANGDNYVPDRDMEVWLESLDANHTESDIINNSIASFPTDDPLVEAWEDYQIKIKQDDLLMTAKTEKLAKQENVTVRFTRGVARFDVEIAAEIADDFVLETVSVWNAFPTTTLWESSFNDYKSQERIKRFYGKRADETTHQLKGGIYSFENYVADPVQNDEVTTCLILGIKNNDKISYYRVNIHPESKVQALKRNQAYKITVKRVRDEGDSTEEGAHGNNRFLLDLVINDWIQDDSGSIQYDGENILALPTTNMVFQPSGGERVDNIFTLGAEHTLILSKKELPDGITVALDGKKLTVKADPSTVDKSGFIELRFGNLVGIIKISQSGEVKQYIDLSTYEVPEFGSGIWASSLTEDIKVYSSGPWTATIYNGPYFSFQENDASDTEKQGINGEGFKLVTSSANAQPNFRYSFVHVVLDEFPDISRVVVLAQRGVGGISISPLPAGGVVKFDPQGVSLAGSLAFNVNVDPNTDWEIVKLGAYPDQFTANVMSGNGSGNFIIAAAVNTRDAEQTATFRIRLKDTPGIYEEIAIHQAKHSLSINPETVEAIEASGGTTNQITVTSTAPWKATLTLSKGTGYFGTPGTMSISGVSGGTFDVTLDETKGMGAKGIVKVEIDGTEINKTLNITQRSIPITPLYAQSYNASAGFWGYAGFYTPSSVPEAKYFTHFRDIMKDPNNFGPNGVVYTGEKSIQCKGIGSDPLSGTAIMNFNAIYPGRYDIWRSWLRANDKNFAIMCTEHVWLNEREFLATLGLSYTFRSANRPIPTKRYLTEAKAWCDSENKGAAIWEYLTTTGPFKKSDRTPVNIDNVVYMNGDGHNNTTTNWPATTIPLIMKDGTMDVGVDPANKLLIVGDFELFGCLGVYQQWNSMNEDSQVFLKNLVAYVVNVAMYGDEFNNQFK